jgi:hypothetical protein
VDTIVEVATWANEEDTAPMAPIPMLTEASDMTPAMPTERVEEKLCHEEQGSEAEMRKKINELMRMAAMPRGQLSAEVRNWINLAHGDLKHCMGFMSAG